MNTEIGPAATTDDRPQTMYFKFKTQSNFLHQTLQPTGNTFIQHRRKRTHGNSKNNHKPSKQYYNTHQQQIPAADNSPWVWGIHISMGLGWEWEYDFPLWGSTYGSTYRYPYGDIHMWIPTGETHIPIPIPIP